MRCIGGCVVFIVLAGGCQDVIDLDPYDGTAPIEARVRPKAITGGTLTIVGESLAIAADPERDRVYVVDLEDGELRHSIALEPGDEPGRVVAGADGLAHVVLRGAGRVATIDLAAGTVLARHSACAEPRGIAHDPSDDSLHVACASGSLVQLEAATGTQLARAELEPDLRDVVLKDGIVYTSTFRAAGIVGSDGTRFTMPDFDDFEPHVAWRTWANGTTGWIAMLHQFSQKRAVPLDPGADGDGGDGGGGDDLPYGGGGDFCQPGITGPVLTVFGEDDVGTTMSLGNARFTVDAAISHDGQLLALAMPGIEEDRSSAQVVPLGAGPCIEAEDEDESPVVGLGQITAVAFTPGGVLAMQSREPARLLIQASPPGGVVVVVELDDVSTFDSGHEIFHRATESGLSCASCHPEGGDDGHVWAFEGLGKRRTQPLDVNLADTAPFHWDGDMDDLDMIMSEVLAHRMGGKRQSDARAESFASWLFAQQRPAAIASVDPTLVDTGEALFSAHACDRCHAGAELGGKTTEAIDGQMLQVPTLRRVALRAPFMHDGRAATLDEAVQDMAEKTLGRELPQPDVDALVAYMRTL
jgi:hypothetical protein